MKLSLKKRIFTCLICVCIMMTTGCFPVYSIIGNETFDVYDENPTLDPSSIDFSSKNQVVLGEYPDGTRAFHFEKCTYEADIDGFKLIDVIGNVFVYYYTGITVKNDPPDSDGNTENKKGYYDKATAVCEYFWTIAAYNYLTGEYTTIHTQTYNSVNDAGKMNGNPVTRSKDSSSAEFMVNVGYFFIMFRMNSSDGESYYYDTSSKEIWKLSNDNKEDIRDELDIDDDSFCCSDVAIKVLDKNKYAVTFMALPESDNFNQTNVMFQLDLEKSTKGNNVTREISLKQKESSVLSAEGGNILSSNAATGNCIYILEQSISSSTVKFGIDNDDRKTSFKIDVGSQSDENNVIQSFSVKDWVDDEGKISDTDSTLELVFKNRIEYYKIERYKASALGLGLINVIIEYNAIKLAAYWLAPLNNPNFSTTYLASDNIPSVVRNDEYFIISSADKGYKQYTLNNDLICVRDGIAAFFAVPHGDKLMVVGFDTTTFKKTVMYYDENNQKTRADSTSMSDFSLAQLPFATVMMFNYNGY